MNFKKSILIALLFLFIGCTSHQSIYKKAAYINTVEEYEKFLNNYPDSEYKSEVIKKILDLEYDNAINENTIIIFEKYLKKYPNSKYNSEIQMRLDLLKVEKQNTTDAYQLFLTKYPNSIFKFSVLSYLEFQELIKGNSQDLMDKYLHKYPYGVFAEKCKYMYNNNDSNSSYTCKANFKEIYPSSAYKLDEILKLIEKKDYLKSLSMLNVYLREKPENKNTARPIIQKILSTVVTAALVDSQKTIKIDKKDIHFNNATLLTDFYTVDYKLYPEYSYEGSLCREVQLILSNSLGKNQMTALYSDLESNKINFSEYINKLNKEMAIFNTLLLGVIKKAIGDFQNAPMNECARKRHWEFANRLIGDGAYIRGIESHPDITNILKKACDSELNNDIKQIALKVIAKLNPIRFK